MSAIILGWDPDRRNHQAAVERVAATGLHLGRWRVGGQLDATAGTDVWLLLEGDRGRGLIGHGVVLPEQPDAGPPPSVSPQSAAAGPDSTAVYVHIAVDSLLPPGEQIAVGLLAEAVPGIPWEAGHPEGLGVEPADEEAIRSLWRNYGPPPGLDPTLPAAGTYPQHAVIRAAVNRYEQDADARRACLAHHGTSCAACGFSFEQKYGEIGRNFIPVHHLVPAALLGSSYELDPLADLVPLCANCHAMAHAGVATPRTVAELRRIIADAGFLPGATVTDEQLEAQRQARQLLGPQ
ncbi:HNH endonuclease [Arthrobacter sp. EPSL27]|uniref:HNH endonuclease n=1 Tax=Arthrobacter sp. EPSL27 TaxID=1745378 RepID=UPI000747F14F|nr:HNH endonuclease [Arthrobacter sp. EPSL27]KUM37043.1 hypothetical protein AR539_06865 [Arthrobacter sp. EPSL27]